MRQDLIAPQFGVWSSFAPATDNPAAQQLPPPQSVVARLAELRDEAHARAVAQVQSAPEVWRL